MEILINASDIKVGECVHVWGIWLTVEKISVTPNPVAGRTLTLHMDDGSKYEREPNARMLVERIK